MRNLLIFVVLAGATTAIALDARSRFAQPAPEVSAVAVREAPRPASGAPAAEIGADRVNASTRNSKSGSDRAGVGARPAAAAAAPVDASRGDHAVATGGVAADTAQHSADSILIRLSARYRHLASLRAHFVQTVENPLLDSKITSRGELFSRRPGRLLLRFSDPKGDVVVSDGHYIWAYYPSVNPGQVLRMRGGHVAGTGALDLQAEFVGDPTQRFRASLDGAAMVTGRAVWVLTLVPRQSAGYASLKLWVDRADGLVRQFEVREENGVTRTFQLSRIAENPALPDSLFQFQPPPGATVVDRGGAASH